MLYAAAIGLLVSWGSASAAGSVVTWTRIEGFGAADVTQIHIGPIYASRPRTVGAGFAALNLNTGYLWFFVKAMSNGNQYDNAPLGAPWPTDVLWGTVVCDSTERFASATWVDTPDIAFTADGDGRFAGLVSLPTACTERPEEIVFLLRHSNRPGNRFIAYGAGRIIR
jgi:hypothetical protein